MTRGRSRVKDKNRKHDDAKSTEEKSRDKNSGIENKEIPKQNKTRAIEELKRFSNTFSLEPSDIQLSFGDFPALPSSRTDANRVNNVTSTGAAGLVKNVASGASTNNVNNVAVRASAKHKNTAVSDATTGKVNNGTSHAAAGHVDTVASRDSANHANTFVSSVSSSHKNNVVSSAAKSHMNNGTSHAAAGHVDTVASRASVNHANTFVSSVSSSNTNNVVSSAARGHVNNGTSHATAVHVNTFASGDNADSVNNVADALEGLSIEKGSNLSHKHENVNSSTENGSENTDNNMSCPVIEKDLIDLKQKVLAILTSSGGKLSINEVCNQFKELYGKNIRKFYRKLKVGRVLNFFQKNLTDVIDIDTESKSNITMVYEYGKGPTSKPFNEQLQKMSKKDCERQLIRSVAHIQGSSKQTAIALDDEEDSSDEEALPTKKGSWKVLAQSDGFVKEDIVQKFGFYRDFQMLHVAYVKYRIIVMYNYYGQKSLRLQYFNVLFKEMFRESFFNKGILKYFISGDVGSPEMIRMFLNTFCSDFLKVTSDLHVELIQSIPVLHIKYHRQLISTVEKLEEVCAASRNLDPTPAEMMLLGFAGNSDIDVTRIPDRRSGLSTMVTEFPDPRNRHLQGRERPTVGEINERVNQIRNRICREGRSVKITELLKELCQFYQVGSIRELRPLESRDLRKDIDIPAIFELMRLQGKVNAFIQAFVTFRNICTLHELEEELCKMEGKSTFEEFKLGPLQQQLLVYEVFQFPPTKDTIPPITTFEVFRLLWKCLDVHRLTNSKSGKETNKLTLQQFMEFFIEQHNFVDPFESGVKISSIALAIQVCRKAWFGDLHNVREISRKFSKQLCDDLDQHLMHSGKNIVGKNPHRIPGEGESLIHKIKDMPLIDAFNEIYSMLQKLKYEACKTLPSTANLINFSDITMNALTIIQKDTLMSKVFHVLLSTAPLKVLEKDDVAILKYLGFKDIIKEMVKEEKELSVKAGKNIQRPAASPKSTVLNVTKKWLSKATEWSISVLSNIEIQIAAEINQNFTAFDDLGHGPFLKFICQDRKLSKLAEANLSSSSSGIKHEIGKQEIADFTNQCEEAYQMEHVTEALLLQFNLREVQKPLQNIITQCFESKQSASSTIAYVQALLCGSEYQLDCLSGDNADQTFIDYATKSIRSAPSLVDLKVWTGWDIIFAVKLGTIKQFLKKYFSGKEVDFSLLETNKDCIVKVRKDCSINELLTAMKELDAQMTSTCVVSMFISNRHISNVPMALLSNHFQNVFLKISANANKAEDLLKFCLNCFCLIPFPLLCSIIVKLFLGPLNQIHGQLNVPKLLLEATQGCLQKRRVLHAIGVHMSINEWMADYKNSLDTQEELPQQEKAPHIEQCDTVLTDVKMEEDEASKIQNEPNVVSDQDDGNKEEQGSILNQLTPDVVVDAVAVATENIIDVTGDQEEPTDTNADVLVDAIQKVKVVEGTKVETNDDNTNRETEDICKEFIETIRKYQFGVGMKFGEQEQKLIEVHREREGRSLHRLSQELYTKDSHFVLELIQNADDNEYPQHFMTSEAVEKPTVAFIVETDKITILNNEIGFMEKNVKALCDVGKSTKGIHRKGYIGQKGIGFKSVFRVTDSPEIHSNGYHIKFDARTGPNGYILPQWVDEWQDIDYQPNETAVPYSWTTKIILPLKKEMQRTKLTSRFHDIHPSLLMFLNRLQTIIIDDKVSASVKIMSKQQVDKNLIQLSQNEHATTWFVRNEEIPIDVRDDVKTTEISVAFPLSQVEQKMLPVQPVFAFLPLRSYGFKFIMQADFEVPSSREDIDKDSPWNQYILQHLPTLVVNTFHSFKNHAHFTDLNGAIEYFKFMDLEDHVFGIFKQVARQIIRLLQREACLPVLGTHSEVDKWSLPSSVITSKQNYDVISSDMLHDQLGLYYIRKEIQSKIGESVLHSLGVTKLSLNQLVDIAKASVRRFNDMHKDESSVLAMNGWIGKWLFAVQSMMQDSCDYSENTLDTLKSLQIIGLADGRMVSLKDETVFFPVESSAKGRKGNKTLQLIENHLCFLSREITSNMDQVEQLQVMRLLKDLGVKTMTPSDLIHNFIIPLFKTGNWKGRKDDLLLACVVYLRQQFMSDPDLFDISEIKEDIVLMTNKGFKQPATDVIYLTPEYGNLINLKKVLNACNWTLISKEYLSHNATTLEWKSWRDFLLALGLQSFCDIRKHKIELHRTDLVGTVWEKYYETWERTEDDTYVIHDLVCPEFDELLKSGKKEQINTFATTLDKRWKDFQKYDLTKPKCVVENTKGETIAQTFSSIFLKMRTSQWICSSESGLKLHIPRELYKGTDKIVVLLANKVRYISTHFRDEDFIYTLGVKRKIEFEDVIREFNKWKEESLFSTTYVHTQNIYKYFQDHVLDKPDVFKQLLDEPFFFLLSSHCSQQLTNASVAEGKFLLKKDVCWEDPSGILVRGGDSALHKRVLKGYYREDVKDFFVIALGVDLYPSTSEYLSIVSSISHKTTLPDTTACQKIFTLFSVLGQKSILDDMAAEVLNDWGLPNAIHERYSFYNDLKGYVNPAVIQQCSTIFEEKIFPTLSNKFVSLSERPLVVFNESLTRVYRKCEELPLILFNDVVSILQKSLQSSRHSKRHEERVVKILCFYKACSLATLFDVALEPEVITVGMKRGCKKWEQILHDIVPFVQRFLASKHPQLYEKLQKKNFANYLENSKFFEVNSLEVIYRLKDRNNVNIKVLKVSKVEKSSEERAIIYVTEKHVKDKGKYDTILTELTELFVGNSEELKEGLLEFVLFLNSVANKERHFERKKIAQLAENEVLWKYPEPEREPTPPPPKPTPAVIVEPKSKSEGEQRLTCWPPRKPGGSGIKTKPDSVKNEEAEILEKWQPPAAPESETSQKMVAPNSEQHAPVRQQVSNTAEPVPEISAPKNLDPSSSPHVASSSGATNEEGKRTSDGLKRKRNESENSNREFSDNNTEIKPTNKKPFSPLHQNEQGQANDNNDARWTNRGRSFSGNFRFDPSLIPRLELLQQYEDLPFSIEVEEGEISPFSKMEGKELDPNNPIGKIGEHCVYLQLRQHYEKEIDAGNVSITWLNSESETGEPYDLKITYAEHLDYQPIYVEVKTTYLDEKKEFEISSQQLKFAFDQGPCFHLYRVSGLSKERDVKIRRLVNLAAYMDNKSVKLFMVL